MECLLTELDLFYQLLCVYVFITIQASLDAKVPWKLLGLGPHVHLFSGKCQSCALLHMIWQLQNTWNIR